MPQITTISLSLGRIAAKRLNSEVSGLAQQPLCDLPLVENLEDGVQLLRRSRRDEYFCFRIQDDPSVSVRWHNLGEAAQIYTLRKRRLVQMDMILLGNVDDNAAAVERARSIGALTDAEVSRLSTAVPPSVVHISNESDKSIAMLLTFVLFVPMMCETYDID